MARALVTLNEPITYVYGWYTVHGRVTYRYRPSAADQPAFTATPLPDTKAVSVSQFDDYEGITWERGWTDGEALLAAYALAKAY